jgi:hypothetical protein
MMSADGYPDLVSGMTDSWWRLFRCRFEIPAPLLCAYRQPSLCRSIDTNEELSGCRKGLAPAFSPASIVSIGLYRMHASVCIDPAILTSRHTWYRGIMGNRDCREGVSSSHMQSAPS